jgi:hypothetical protein
MARYSKSNRIRLFWAAMLVWVAGCADLIEAPEPTEQGPIDLASFAVSDFFTPSGHMGDGQTPGHLTMSVGTEGCRSLKLTDGRGSCYQFTYGPPADKLWAGVFWAFPANNWGAEPGRLFKPWVFDKKKGVIRQRYNRIRFSAAARRDTFEVAVRTSVGEGDAAHCYTLRHAVLEFSGTKSVKVDSEAALEDAPKPSMFTPCPEAKARIVLPPGDYEVKLRSGFSVDVDGAAAADAEPSHDKVRFTLTQSKSTSKDFAVEVGGEVVPFSLGTPPVQVAFFAGGIRDDRLEKIRCPTEGQGCRYVDNVLTGSPKSISVGLARDYSEINIPSSILRFETPCVQNPRGDAATRDDVDSSLVCPDGTWTSDGLIATCPLGLIGAMQENGKIICCDGGNPLPKGGGEFSCGTIDERDPKTGEFVSTPRPIFTGKWRKVEEIEGTLLGAFGWSTSYTEFETAPGSGELNIPAAEVPPTYVFVDNIVWDYARQEP